MNDLCLPGTVYNTRHARDVISCMQRLRNHECLSGGVSGMGDSDGRKRLYSRLSAYAIFHVCDLERRACALARVFGSTECLREDTHPVNAIYDMLTRIVAAEMEASTCGVPVPGESKEEADARMITANAEAVATAKRESDTRATIYSTLATQGNTMTRMNKMFIRTKCTGLQRFAEAFDMHEAGHDFAHATMWPMSMLITTIHSLCSDWSAVCMCTAEDRELVRSYLVYIQYALFNISYIVCNDYDRLDVAEVVNKVQMDGESFDDDDDDQVGGDMGVEVDNEQGTRLFLHLLNMQRDINTDERIDRMYCVPATTTPTLLLGMESTFAYRTNAATPEERDCLRKHIMNAVQKRKWDQVAAGPLMCRVDASLTYPADEHVFIRENFTDTPSALRVLETMHTTRNAEIKSAKRFVQNKANPANSKHADDNGNRRAIETLMALTVIGGMTANVIGTGDTDDGKFHRKFFMYRRQTAELFNSTRGPTTTMCSVIPRILNVPGGGFRVVYKGKMSQCTANFVDAVYAWAWLAEDGLAVHSHTSVAKRIMEIARKN